MGLLLIEWVLFVLDLFIKWIGNNIVVLEENWKWGEGVRFIRNFCKKKKDYRYVCVVFFLCLVFYMYISVVFLGKNVGFFGYG